MCEDSAFKKTIFWSNLKVDEFDVICFLLAMLKGCGNTWGDSQPHEFVAEFSATKWPVGVIFHGMITLACAKVASYKFPATLKICRIELR